LGSGLIFCVFGGHELVYKVFSVFLVKNAFLDEKQNQPRFFSHHCGQFLGIDRHHVVVNFWVLIDNALSILFPDNCDEQHVVHLFNFLKK
jgi:hypothetical protein